MTQNDITPRVIRRVPLVEQDLIILACTCVLLTSLLFYLIIIQIQQISTFNQINITDNRLYCRVTRRVPLMKQELITLPQHLSFVCPFVLFAVLLSVFDLRFLITPLLMYLQTICRLWRILKSKTSTVQVYFNQFIILFNNNIDTTNIF